jgi:hypothetical protein
VILYCCADLLWASKIKGTADALAIPCRPARNREMIDARLADSPVKAVIVDLDAGEAAAAVMARLRGPDADDRTRNLTVIAFGSHVEVGALQAARAAGADSVMTRGTLHASLPDVLRRLDALPSQA